MPQLHQSLQTDPGMLIQVGVATEIETVHPTIALLILSEGTTQLLLKIRRELAARSDNQVLATTPQIQSAVDNLTTDNSLVFACLKSPQNVVPPLLPGLSIDIGDF